jgi:hypothetical protein
MFSSGFTELSPRGYRMKSVSFRLAVQKHDKYVAFVSPSLGVFHFGTTTVEEQSL